MPAETIRDGDRVLAVVFRPAGGLDPDDPAVETKAGGDLAKETTLGLDRDMATGVIDLAEGFEGSPHYHPNDGTKSEAPTRSQFKFVVEGRLRITLYTDEGETKRTVDLEEKEGIQLLGGHGVEALEDTVMISIVTGPTEDGERKTVSIEERQS